MASLVSAVIFFFLAVSILERAELVSVLGSRTLVAWTVWIFTAFLGLNILVNYFLGSRTERRIMAPVSLALCILCMAVSVAA